MLVEYTLIFKTLKTHFIMVAMATYLPLYFFYEKWFFFRIRPIFCINFFNTRIKKNIRMLKKVLHIGGNNIFTTNFCEKRKKFKSTPLFFKLLLKQELKKSIRMFKNVLNIIMVAMATYFFLKIIVKMKIGQMKPIFFYYCF